MGLEKVLSTPFSVHAIDNFNSVIIYGAGNNGKEVCKVLQKDSRFDVIAFLDLRATKDTFVEGVPVFHPEQNRISVSVRKESLVVVAVFNRDVSLSPIFDLLKKQGFSNIISFVQLHHFYSEIFGNKYWLGPIAAYKNYKNELEEVFAMLADNESRQIFESVLKYRLSGNHEALTEPEGLETQYFSKTLSPVEKKLRFIDGGAYDGDTLLAMQKLGIQCESIASFEPDLSNFKKLVDFTSTYRGSVANEINIFPCAVWSKTEYLRFSSGNTEASRITGQGTNTILGVSIDDIIPDFRPGFIKMDIEGAELEGLYGVQKTIRKHKPRLGICLYHTPEHLWEIPLLIKTWNLNYRFHIRSHGNNGFDLVLYALPGQ